MSACKACSDQLGVTESLEEVGIEVKYWGRTLDRNIKGWRKTHNDINIRSIHILLKALPAELPQ